METRTPRKPRKKPKVVKKPRLADQLRELVQELARQRDQVINQSSRLLEQENELTDVIRSLRAILDIHK